MKLTAAATLILVSFMALSQGLTEKHETSHYSIKYPDNWTLFEDDDLGEAIHIVAPKASAEDAFAENVSVIIQDLSAYNIELDDYVKLALKQIVENTENGEVLKDERFEAGRIKSHKVIYKGRIEGVDLKLIRYYQMNNKKAYILTYTALESDFEEHKLYGQQILNSFRLKF